MLDVFEFFLGEFDFEVECDLFCDFGLYVEEIGYVVVVGFGLDVLIGFGVD